MGICENDNNKEQSLNNLGNNRIKNNILQGKKNIIKQASIKGNPDPFSIEGEIRINEQMKKFICKIILNNKTGTGFVCKIPFPNEFILLPVLITNKSVINKEGLQSSKMLEITFDNDSYEKIISITPERKIYSSQKYDITFIEIIPKIDGINKFLETNILEKSVLEDLNLNDIKESKNMTYVLQYKNGIKCIESHGIINKIEEDFISHSCSKNIGGPIFLFLDQKIVGINIGNGKGILLKKPIEEFYIFVNNNKTSNKPIMNTIDCYYITNNDGYFNLLNDYVESHDIHIEEYMDLMNNYEEKNDILNKEYNKGRKKKKFLEENVKIYVDSQLINFSYKYKYKSNNNKIHVKFVFKQILNDLSFLFAYCNNLETIDLNSYDSTHITNMLGMFNECKNLKSVDLSEFKSTKDINMEFMFNGCKSLKIINFPSDNYPKINVTNLSDLFFSCLSLESVDLSSFNTSKVKRMNNLFNGCSSLTSINLFSFNTSNVINIERMFSSCMSLKLVDLSKFNTEKVENMKEMFFDCRTIIELNLSSFNTSNVKSMDSMFMGCHSLKIINLSSFNTINVINMSNMFGGCNSLQSVDLSSFNTINVTNMHGMFQNCTSLKTLNLSSFKTPKLIDIGIMFAECEKLEYLDLSSFNTMNVNRENKMILETPIFINPFFNDFFRLLSQNIFYGCLNLKTLKCSDKYLLQMFNDIKKLNGAV